MEIKKASPVPLQNAPTAQKQGVQQEILAKAGYVELVRMAIASSLSNISRGRRLRNRLRYKKEVKKALLSPTSIAPTPKN